MTRGALIGFGNIAEKGHWPTYASSPDVSIEAIVEPSAARREAAKALKPSLRFYDRADDLLQSESLDFVDICTPPVSHTALARAALLKGVDVLCEKPLCLKTDEYRLLGSVARDSGRLVFAVHNWKYAPILARAYDLIRSGHIGRVWHTEIFVMRNQVCVGTSQGVKAEDWRTDRSTAGGGITMDHGWHAFYLLLNAMGQDPKDVLARMEGPEGGLEEVSKLLVQFPEGDGYIHMTWRADQRKNLVTMQGTEGTILVDDGRLLVTGKDGKQFTEAYPALSAGSHHSDWFGSLFADFLAERSDSKKRGSNFREAGWCVALTEAAYASQAAGSHTTRVQFPSAASPSAVES